MIEQKESIGMEGRLIKHCIHMSINKIKKQKNSRTQSKEQETKANGSRKGNLLNEIIQEGVPDYRGILSPQNVWIEGGPSPHQTSRCGQVDNLE